MREDIARAVVAAEEVRKKQHKEWQLRHRAMGLGICPECGGAGRKGIVNRGFFLFGRAYSEFWCGECQYVHSELLTD